MGKKGYINCSRLSTDDKWWLNIQSGSSVISMWCDLSDFNHDMIDGTKWAPLRISETVVTHIATLHICMNGTASQNAKQNRQNARHEPVVSDLICKQPVLVQNFIPIKQDSQLIPTV